MRVSGTRPRHHGPLTTGLDQRDPDIKKRYARGASRSIYKAARRAPLGRRTDWLVYPLHSALELLPSERRIVVLLAYLRSRTKQSEIAIAALEFCATPAVVTEMIRLLKTSQSITVREKETDAAA